MHSASIDYKQTKQCTFIFVIAISIILIILERFVGLPAEPPTFIANVKQPITTFFYKTECETYVDVIHVSDLQSEFLFLDTFCLNFHIADIHKIRCSMPIFSHVDP